jgi:hypothetical protein
LANPDDTEVVFGWPVAAFWVGWLMPAQRPQHRFFRANPKKTPLRHHPLPKTISMEVSPTWWPGVFQRSVS